MLSVEPTFDGISLKELEKEWQEEGVEVKHGSVLMDCIIMKMKDIFEVNEWLDMEDYWDITNEYLKSKKVITNKYIYYGTDYNPILDLKVNDTFTMGHHISFWSYNPNISERFTDPDKECILVTSGEFQGIDMSEYERSDEEELILAPFNYKITKIDGIYKYIEKL